MWFKDKKLMSLLSSLYDALCRVSRGSSDLGWALHMQDTINLG